MKGTVEQFRAQGALKEDQDFDMILFNQGNWGGKQAYTLQNVLESDLRFLNHTEKPLIFISPFQEYNVEAIEELRIQYPNLLVVSEKRRNSKMMAPGILPTITGHLCMPGPVEHHALNALHLINLMHELGMMKE